MKKYIVILIVTLLLVPSLALAKSQNLYDFVSHKSVVNVKVDSLTVESGYSEIKSQEITNIFKKALELRRSVNFNIVKSDQEADLIIKGNVKSFYYTANDPIDVFVPVALVADLLVNKGYARLKFDISVFSTEKNKIVWGKKLKATLSEVGMTADDSVNLIMERAAKIFIRKCFGKPKSH